MSGKEKRCTVMAPEQSFELFGGPAHVSFKSADFKLPSVENLPLTGIFCLTNRLNGIINSSNWLSKLFAVN